MTRQQALALGSPCVVALIGMALAELGLRIVHRVRLLPR
jgi:hypothetical protein